VSLTDSKVLRLFVERVDRVLGLERLERARVLARDRVLERARVRPAFGCFRAALPPRVADPFCLRAALPLRDPLPERAVDRLFDLPVFERELEDFAELPRRVDVLAWAMFPSS